MSRILLRFRPEEIIAGRLRFVNMKTHTTTFRLEGTIRYQNTFAEPATDLHRFASETRKRLQQISMLVPNTIEVLCWGIFIKFPRKSIDRDPKTIFCWFFGQRPGWTSSLESPYNWKFAKWKSEIFFGVNKALEESSRYEKSLAIRRIGVGWFRSGYTDNMQSKQWLIIERLLRVFCGTFVVQTIP